MSVGCGIVAGLASFFCQAEDGIRCLVRSRGLGSVYKRQTYTLPEILIHELFIKIAP